MIGKILIPFIFYLIMDIDSIKVIQDDDEIWSDLLPVIINNNIRCDNITRINITPLGVEFRFYIPVPIHNKKTISMVLSEWTSKESVKR
jgi:hypothetical protein